MLTLLTVPVYLRVLGAEAYGFVGLFVSLVVLTGLCDLGVSPTMSRIMARAWRCAGRRQSCGTSSGRWSA